MIKFIKLMILTVITLSLTFTLGCTKKFVDQEDGEVKKDSGQKTASEKNSEKVELKIWSWYSFGDLIKDFEEENKGIKVTEKIFDFSKCDQEYMKSLASATGPDVLVFDSGFFGQYTVDNILQNLLEEPYSAGKYKNDFLGWDSGLSIDNKQLLSLTYSTAPYITMYRTDIMKENGFPSEPEEFGKFIEDPNNIIKIGLKLKGQGKYIFQYPTDETDIVGASVGYFDNDLNYIREGELFAKAIDLAQQASDNDLISNKNFWQESGKKAIQESQLVMIPLASYTMSHLENYVPEQKGKWRVAKAPLGVAAWAKDSRLSINIQSSHKNEAWKLLEYIVTHCGMIQNSVPAYIPTLKNPDYLNQKAGFFGDQNVYPILVDLAQKMTQTKLTPLDNKAHDIYIKGIWESLVTNGTAYEEIEKMKKNVEKEVAEERESLLE